MEITTLLMGDHRDLEELFVRLDGLDEEDDLESICQEIFDLLDVHAGVEEAILYPDLEPVRQLAPRIAQAAADHQAAKRRVADLRNMDPGDPTFDGSMRLLREEVLRHVEEEERELFPIARRILGPRMLALMGEEATRLRQQLLDRMVDGAVRELEEIEAEVAEGDRSDDRRQHAEEAEDFQLPAP